MEWNVRLFVRVHNDEVVLLVGGGEECPPVLDVNVEVTPVQSEVPVRHIYDLRVYFDTVYVKSLAPVMIELIGYRTSCEAYYENVKVFVGGLCRHCER